VCVLACVRVCLPIVRLRHLFCCQPCCQKSRGRVQAHAHTYTQRHTHRSNIDTHVHLGSRLKNMAHKQTRDTRNTHTHATEHTVQTHIHTWLLTYASSSVNLPAWKNMRGISTEPQPDLIYPFLAPSKSPVFSKNCTASSVKNL